MQTADVLPSSRMKNDLAPSDVRKHRCFYFHPINVRGPASAMLQNNNPKAPSHHRLIAILARFFCCGSVAREQRLRRTGAAGISIYRARDISPSHRRSNQTAVPTTLCSFFSLLAQLSWPTRRGRLAHRFSSFSPPSPWLRPLVPS